MKVKSNITKKYIAHCTAMTKSKFLLHTFKKAVNPRAYVTEKGKAIDTDWQRIKRVDFYDGIKKDTQSITDFDLLRIAPMYVYTRLNFRIRGSKKATKDDSGNIIGYEKDEFTDFYIDLKSQGGVNQRYIRNLYNSFKYDDTTTTIKIKRKKENGIVIETVAREKKVNVLQTENIRNILDFSFNDFSDLMFVACNKLVELYENGSIIFHADFFDKSTYKSVGNAVDRYIGRQKKHCIYNPKNAFSLDQKATSDDDDDRTKAETVTTTENESENKNFCDYMVAFGIVDDREFLEQALKSMKSQKGKKQENREKVVMWFFLAHGLRVDETCAKFDITPRTLQRYTNKFIKHARKEADKLKKA